MDNILKKFILMLAVIISFSILVTTYFIAVLVRTRLMEVGRPVPDWIDSDFIFVGQRGVFSTRGVGVITEKLGKLAGFKESLGTHRFRHTFARSALDPDGYLF